MTASSLSFNDFPDHVDRYPEWTERSPEWDGDRHEFAVESEDYG